ncbi:2-keto-3-deoxy-L-rhamnonate aldolase RhmA [Paraburkholderia caballeronis]|uniref:HpcH/HpaI aldolase family protein n=1 Tax=Paraburkholderia caballeronis TaxID=416943 RepID=UPI0010670003|nr:aldolase/citrate lyase family protein [Paraburkholderia caballeronis]TDV36514.1 2-keto-3-deoxy-L-rhamnonate aldolase RhmA [Paraburkholderia caballeronis]
MSERHSSENAPSFRARLASGDFLVGTFIKTPTSHAIELLGQLRYDFVVIDAEHAAFDRGAIDVAMLAAHATDIPALVRVAGGTAPEIGTALDCGAEGVLVPHMNSASRAAEVVRMCRFRPGRRGYSGAPRAGGYGSAPMQQSVERQDARTTVIAMIEDPEALDEIDAIVAVEGLDAVFVGRADLAVALGAPSAGAPAVLAAVERISGAARAAGKPVCVMVGDAREAPTFQASGATAFIVSSDQGLMRKAAAAALAEMEALRGAGRP